MCWQPDLLSVGMRYICPVWMFSGDCLTAKENAKPFSDQRTWTGFPVTSGEPRVGTIPLNFFS